MNALVQSIIGEQGKTPLEVLEKARLLVTPRKQWTRMEWARSKQSKPTSPEAPNACKWCAAGALEAAAGIPAIKDGKTDAWARLKEAAGDSILNYNDSHTHEEVLALFDLAIAAERAKVSA